jgi:hypothetical protein
MFTLNVTNHFLFFYSIGKVMALFLTVYVAFASFCEVCFEKGKEISSTSASF